MSCNSCAMGLPCDGGTGGPLFGDVDWFGDPEKNRNTVDDLAAGGLAILASRQARRSAGAEPAEPESPGGMGTVRVFGRDVPVLYLVGGGAAALGVGLLVVR